MPEDSTTKAAAPATYAVDRLVKEASDRFDVPSHVAAGAFSGSSKKNLTIDEARKLIDAWQKKPVEVDNPIGGEED